MANYKTGIKSRNYRHGLCKHPLYIVYIGIKNRCYNKNAQKYNIYGGRGIKLCEEWQDFISFYNWSITNGYKKGLSIDRINNNGDYSPDNCRYTTSIIQNNNKRDSKGIKMFCRKNGLIHHYGNILRHLNNGKSTEWILCKYKNEIKKIA